MATTKKTARTITLDAALEPADELSPDAPADAAVCPSCGELLAWHDAPCLTASAPSDDEAAGPAVIRRPAATTFAYDLGQPVQPPTQARAYRIIWRGQMKERNPATGWLYRVNVYRLDDGFWDCYREEELQAATQLLPSAATAA